MLKKLRKILSFWYNARLNCYSKIFNFRSIFCLNFWNLWFIILLNNNIKIFNWDCEIAKIIKRIFDTLLIEYDTSFSSMSPLFFSFGLSDSVVNWRVLLFFLIGITIGLSKESLWTMSYNDSVWQPCIDRWTCMVLR